MSGRAQRLAKVATPSGTVQIGDGEGTIRILVLLRCFDRLGKQQLGLLPDAGNWLALGLPFVERHGEPDQAMGATTDAASEVLLQFRLDQIFGGVFHAITCRPAIVRVVISGQRDQRPTEFEFQVAGHVVFRLTQPILDREGVIGRFQFCLGGQAALREDRQPLIAMALSHLRRGLHLHSKSGSTALAPWLGLTERIADHWFKSVNGATAKDEIESAGCSGGRFDRKVGTVGQDSVQDLPGTVSFSRELAAAKILLKRSRNELLERLGVVEIGRPGQLWIGRQGASEKEQRGTEQQEGSKVSHDGA